MATESLDFEKILRDIPGIIDLHKAEPEFPPAPEWPECVLPDVLEHYVNASAASIGVPPEMIAVPLLVFAGGTIGNMVRMQPKEEWHVYPTLWAGVVGDPAGKKSPSLGAAQKPVNKLQHVLFERYQAEQVTFDAEKQEKGKAVGFPPKLEHLFTTDVTMEALTMILADCRGVTIVKDELSGFIGGMNKFKGGGKGDDRQNYLSLWAGATVKVDRVTGGTRYVSHPVAGIYGGIQPDHVGALHSKDGSRDGMIERFLLFWPDVHRTGWTDATVDPALTDRVAGLFASLRSLTPPTDRKRITVQMSAAAKTVMVDWYNANDAAIGAVSGLRKGFYGKLDSQLYRIALILHCLHNPDDPRVMTCESTMQSAIEIVEFFRAHLDRVLPLIGDSSTGEPVGLPGRVLRYLNKPELQNPEGWVRRRVISKSLRNARSDTLTNALDELERCGRVERRVIKTATRPAEEWRVVSGPRSLDMDREAF